MKILLKKTLKRTLSALMITGLMATSSMAAVQAPLETMDSRGHSSKTMMPAPMDLEQKSLKSLMSLKDEQTNEGQKSAKSLKSDILGIAGEGAKFAGKTALDLITIDNTLTVAGLVGSAVFGPEVLAVTETLKKFNQTLDNIEFVKNIKTKAGKFVRTAIEKGVTTAVKKTYKFISSKISGWFKKKK